MSKPATTVAAIRGSSPGPKNQSDTGRRYFQLMLLVLAAGAIYPILYLRQVYQTTMLEVFQIDHSQLGYLYSMLGTIFLLSYLPSGWLADRIAPRFLIFFSLVATGVLGLWYSTVPSMTGLMIIFGCWGLTTGLTFWASVLKRVKMIAHHTEQGRFFGILDGGRGLVEALLATVALALFAFATESHGQSSSEGFKQVVYLYAFTCIAIGCVLVLVEDPASLQDTAAVEKGKYNLLSDLMTLAKIPELWLVTAIVFCGYHLFWATYSFSDYLQGNGMTAIMAGTITTLKLWMRPIGGLGGGFLGDRFSNISVLIVALTLATLAMVGLIVFPAINSLGLLIGTVIFIGLMAYAIRGLYWAILDTCNIPLRITGLAIGIVSVIGYLPDAFIPLINGYLTEHFPGAPGYRLYFGYIAFVGLLGILAALSLRARINRKSLLQNV
ncbi:MFS transporter [Pseudomonas cannabina]|uniref:MFS transporter n=3 Tax=Pseudomonas syringae group TaxID=136849 RepID=A0A8T8C0W5_PSEYM|nr:MULTISPECIES: MFS transporter [Pseudomonas syringae group]KPB72301.1 Major facilitator superfamily MFS_1 [Pseudomonas syringae pv. maculicola]KPW15934.1 Major facilitator superfamily [Pseudomonas cannabina pv. alisalensis]MBM0141354.1 MFS transporter [Pseudomonas cannabina pv. alisalensis]QHE96893.1 MFS transporter [Pseudomonas syringae pv. maculicola str. ES4326]QQN20057.1 MFS transporter [Pseudomonas cannabina pv. alisalensis]